VKSVSFAEAPSAESLSQVQALAGRLPQEQVGPVTVFSTADLSQLQSPADCLPQEHLAWVAQIQPELLLPQQVLGGDMMDW